MKRPADQAKLLFLYFLRYSSAAFASEPIKSSLSKVSPSTLHGTSSSGILDGHISLRVARRTDIPSIQRCNLASLPENYNSNFYMHHIRNWPELALVMEHVPKGYERYDRRRINPGLGYNPEERPLEIVGYVLGKVERIPKPARRVFRASRVIANDDGFRARDYSTSIQQPMQETLGHVTSLAIMDNFRRKGLAGQLMNQLHYHLKDRFNADAVGLHVRVSNEAATRLYAESMGYTVVDVIKGYYQDGEDAFLMRKEFTDCEDEIIQSHGPAVLRGESKRWFSGWSGGKGQWTPTKEMELPRNIPLLPKKVVGTSSSEQRHAVRERNPRDQLPSEGQPQQLYSR
eukprot:CAMPEP_0172501520 /NCGR_PEP_ID=MMETSP1066-20121228/150601_1 /TAXON_ID=671091 /ORGANISM="Coscinodiscus wailesii, Strain CCMP2513" /LENGTH=343 /DNA_ID=CAMNT_0013276331 /DNA_START=100 /DNA_END=1131 /DNA_ORIENTATION=+